MLIYAEDMEMDSLVYLKDKVIEGERKTIYQHPNYSDEQKDAL